MDTNIFEQASRERIRFRTDKGIVSTEDLWTLSLQSLNDIAKAINHELKGLQEESFIPTESTKPSDPLRLQLNIVVHIINYKVEEQRRRDKRREVKALRMKLLAVIADKEEEALHSKSLEQLKADLQALEP